MLFNFIDVNIRAGLCPARFHLTSIISTGTSHLHNTQDIERGNTPQA